jgi:hypothetical protein
MKLPERIYCKNTSTFRGVTYEVLPLRSYAFIPKMLSFLGIVSELMLWNSFQCRRHIFVWIFQYPEIFVPSRQTLFLEIPGSHFAAKSGE